MGGGGGDVVHFGFAVVCFFVDFCLFVGCCYVFCFLLLFFVCLFVCVWLLFWGWTYTSMYYAVYLVEKVYMYMKRVLKCTLFMTEC